jgi:hypothetical protein
MRLLARQVPIVTKLVWTEPIAPSVQSPMNVGVVDVHPHERTGGGQHALGNEVAHDAHDAPVIRPRSITGHTAPGGRFRATPEPASA